MTERFEVRVPDIGDFDDVEVVEILVAPGDRVAVEDSLLSVESDKATMEIPSPVAGVVCEIQIALGDKVSEGSPLLDIEVEALASGPAAEAVRAPAGTEIERASPAPTGVVSGMPPKHGPEQPPVPRVDVPRTGSLPHASPRIRKLAREFGVELSKTIGTGPHGRVLEEDLKSHVRNRLAGGAGAGVPAPPIASVDFSRFGEVASVPLTRIQRKAGANLSRSWSEVPHVTQHDEADVTELEDFRRSHADRAAASGGKLTLLPFLMKAVVVALRVHPRFRASLDASGENLIVKNYFHIGVAVETDAGLVVPVVRDVDCKGLLELAAELAQISARARERKLSPSDLAGACFSISSLGGIGGTGFTPIVNAPEVAILGVSRIGVRAVWRSGTAGGEAGVAPEPRKILPLSLSYDHRVIDGAEAVRFTTRVGAALSNLAHLLL